MCGSSDGLIDVTSPGTTLVGRTILSIKSREAIVNVIGEVLGRRVVHKQILGMGALAPLVSTVF